MPRRILITCAEVSGDRHAAHLIQSLRQLDPRLIFEGHGGPEMERAGAILHHETTHRAAMNFHAAGRAREVWWLLRWTKRYFDRNKPDLLICVDSPDLNLHFAKAAHARGIPVLYYIAPQLWAWREGRMKQLRKWVDKVACILPFEQEYFRKNGVDATFVGHPIFDQLPPGRGPAPGPRFPARPPMIGLLPGSRRSEALANFPHLLDVARRMGKEYPDAKFLVPTTPATEPVVEELARGFPNLRHGLGEFDAMVPQCDLCLTVSGTATLHVAGYAIPMIVVYRGSPVLWHLLGKWILKTRTFALVNLLNEDRKHLVREIIPWHGSNEPVAQLALEYLKEPGKLAEQSKQLEKLVASLDHPGASINTGKIALSMLKGPEPRMNTDERA
jgi:lipid-A-disaccharide synthase